MKTFTTIIEKCKDTGLFVGYISGLTGVHFQAESLDELQKKLISTESNEYKGRKKL